MVYRVGSMTYRVQWASMSGQYPGETDARLLRRLSPRALHSFDGAVVTTPLTATQEQTLRQRPLFRDADVLFTSVQNPVCQTGLTVDQAQAVARGQVRGWSAVGIAVPAPLTDAFSAYWPWRTDDNALPEVLFGQTARPPATALQPSANALALAGNSFQTSVVAAGRWSAWRGATDAVRARVCPIPVGGVTPSDQTVTDATYPFAFTAYWVRNRVPVAPYGLRMAKYEARLFGPLGRAYLHTYGRRDRIPAF